MRVLQVENDLDAAGAVERLIKAAGSACDTAPSGRLGLELAMFETYDLILVAFVLPDMTGADVIARLDAAGIGAPVLVRMRQRALAEAYADIIQRFVAGGLPEREVPKAPEQTSAYNRESVRHKILKAGQIVYRNSCCIMDCTILNISATGACIQPADAFEERGNFILKIAHGPSRRCEVRWRSGGKLGVRFIQ
ncbi:MAG TPA: response regulator [Rhodospirillales bacterium]|nr:response regulator [Rhodospirillales bacterium]